MSAGSQGEQESWLSQLLVEDSGEGGEEAFKNAVLLGWVFFVFVFWKGRKGRNKQTDVQQLKMLEEVFIQHDQI